MSRDKLLARRIEVEVEKLVLHGLTSMDSNGIARAMERKIVELVHEQVSREPIAENKEVPRINLEQFAISPNAGAERIGEQVARIGCGGLVR